ncbi:MAG TPA: lipid-A-disaccharide synthase [Ignavibacteria bacterium]|nr:lipid-A-disaccharide synthase [Ignavibacteria bacterium]
MPTNNEKSLLIIAGESSGDLHGAALVKNLLQLNPELKIYGIGGDKMQEAGMQLIYHINKMAFLGFLEVLEHLPFIKKVQKELITFVKEKNIKDIVLIDYPGFNLNIAKKFKKLNLNITYYISPQIWAWGSGRIKKIKNLVNKMLVVFPFEEKMYKEYSVDAEFVGHPLITRLNEYQFLTKEELYDKFELEKNKDIILLLSGSREHEVKSIFPECIQAANIISGKYNMQIVVACADNIAESLYYSLTDYKDFKVIKNYTYDLLKHSKLGIIKSGTSTLEAALMELPMVIVYKTSVITYLIGKSLVKIKDIGMANILSGKKVVPELIQQKVKSKFIIEEVSKLLSDNTLYINTKNELKKIKESLGSEDASKKAAEIIHSSLYEN